MDKSYPEENETIESIADYMLPGRQEAFSLENHLLARFLFFFKATASNVIMTKENHRKLYEKCFPCLFISSCPCSLYSDSAFPR